MVYVIQVCGQLASRSICSCSQAVRKPVWHLPLLCVQWKTPDDRQRNCPKHVEFHSKNKFEKLVHLVGFIVRNLSRLTVIWMSNLLTAAVNFRRLLREKPNVRGVAQKCWTPCLRFCGLHVPSIPELTLQCLRISLLLLKICPETSVRDYHYSLRNKPKRAAL